MDLFETMLKRRSCRDFTDEIVKDEDIDLILHAAMSGPSAMNKQPWVFYVIKDENKIKELRKAAKYSDINGKVAIVVCGNSSCFLPQQLSEFWIQDTSAATENILLAATALNLGSLWCGIYPQKEAVTNVQKVLGISEKLIPLNIIYIGHPNKQIEARDQYNEKLVNKI